MKQSIILSVCIFISFSFISCSVTDSETSSHKIIGKWEWVKSTGGFAGHTISPDSAGFSRQQIYYAGNQEFSFFQSDTLVFSGTYILVEDNGDTFVKYEIEGNSFFPEQKVYSHENTLILMDQCADCYTNTYERIH